MEKPTASFERSLLRDADIAFGAKHYELLRTIGAFVQQLKDAGAHVKADGSMTGNVDDTTPAKYLELIEQTFTTLKALVRVSDSASLLREHQG